MKKTIFFLAIILSFWSCATFSQSYKQGTEAAMNKNWDEAVQHYERAVLENPNNSVYRLALLRSKISASYSHLLKARLLASQDKREDALTQYEKALFYDPMNRAIFEEARKYAGEEVKEEEPKEIKIEPPIKLRVPDEKVQLKFTLASLRSIFQALAKFAQANIVFDEQFKDQPMTVDLTNMNFEEAVQTLCVSSKNFYRIMDEKTLIIVPDQPMNRAKYELNVIKTFYLSNINAQDIQGSLQQMLRTQFKAPSIIVDKNLNSVTVRDTPEIVELAGKVIRLWDKPKGEVVIELEIMEASRLKMKEIGLELDKYLLGAQYVGPNATTTSTTSPAFKLKDIDFSKSENYQVILPTSILRFLETEADTKIISQPRLRGIEGEEISYLVGDQIPIPQTTFTPIAAGGVSQQPIVSYEYKDVGIDVKIKPRIHQENEVTLELEIKIKSLGGTGYANIPIITTREVKNIIRLKDGETNLLAGLLKDEERKSIKGIAGIKNIPLLGSLFSRTDQTIQQTDVILTITPYIIRTIPMSQADEKPLWVGLEEAPVSQVMPGMPPGQSDFPSGQEELEARMRHEEMIGEPEGAGANQIFLTPNDFDVPVKREFRINVGFRSAEEVNSMSLNVSFNASVLKLKDVLMGGIVQSLGKSPSFLKNIDNNSGTCTIGFSSPNVKKGVKGSGSLAVLVFEAAAQGESSISVSSISANSPTGRALNFESRDSTVVVR